MRLRCLVEVFVLSVRASARLMRVPRVFQRQDGLMQRSIREVNASSRWCVLWDLDEDTHYSVQVRMCRCIIDSGAPVQSGGNDVSVEPVRGTLKHLKSEEELLACNLQKVDQRVSSHQYSCIYMDPALHRNVCRLYLH